MAYAVVNSKYYGSNEQIRQRKPLPIVCACNTTLSACVFGLYQNTFDDLTYHMIQYTMSMFAFIYYL